MNLDQLKYFFLDLSQFITDLLVIKYLDIEVINEKVRMATKNLSVWKVNTFNKCRDYNKFFVN